MSVQRNLPACSNIYVRTMVFTHMCQTNVPLLIIFGKFEDLPTFPSPLPQLINFYNSPRRILRRIFIRQFRIGVLLQILCVFSEHLTLGERLYI